MDCSVGLCGKAWKFGKGEMDVGDGTNWWIFPFLSISFFLLLSGSIWIPSRDFVYAKDFPIRVVDAYNVRSAVMSRTVVRGLRDAIGKNRLIAGSWSTAVKTKRR